MIQKCAMTPVKKRCPVEVSMKRTPVDMHRVVEETT